MVHPFPTQLTDRTVLLPVGVFSTVSEPKASTEQSEVTKGGPYVHGGVCVSAGSVVDWRWNLRVEETSWSLLMQRHLLSATCPHFIELWIALLAPVNQNAEAGRQQCGSQQAGPGWVTPRPPLLVLPPEPADQAAAPSLVVHLTAAVETPQARLCFSAVATARGGHSLTWDTC